MKSALEDYRKSQPQGVGLNITRDAEVRDVLIFLAQMGATQSNGRPKGRAYLDFLRAQFKSDEFSKPGSKLVLLP